MKERKRMGSWKIDDWERVLKDSPDSYKKWFSEEKKYLVKNITKNATVLEVGCGNGRSLNDIIDVTKNLTGIDYDKAAVERAKNNFKNYPEIKILAANAKELPFQDNSFDFVICMTSFANFGGYKVPALKEMGRVVKKKGFVILSVYSEDSFEERMKLYRKVNFPIKEINGTTVTLVENSMDNTSEQFSKKQLIDLFNKANLIVVEIKKLEIAYICKLMK